MLPGGSVQYFLIPPSSQSSCYAKLITSLAPAQYSKYKHQSGIDLLISARQRKNIFQADAALQLLLPPLTPLHAKTSLSLSLFFFFFSLMQLFHSAAGVNPLILAWQGGRDTDGTRLVNLICKSELFLCSSPCFLHPCSSSHSTCLFLLALQRAAVCLFEFTAY